MGPFKPIPRTALPDTMTVRLPTADGGFADPVAVVGVRLVRRQSISKDEHRSADADAGTVYVDAVNSWGAFEVPAGSRLTIRGRSYYVRECYAAEDLFGRVHHWELAVG